MTTNGGEDDPILGKALRRGLRTAAILAAVTFVLSALFVVRSFQALDHFQVSAVSDPLAAPTARPVVPQFDERPDPLAILVLDLSASMKTNDPDFDQLAAAAVFLRSFALMARSATTDARPPKLAIVLYSSVARTVAFDGEWWATLGSPEDVEPIIETLAEVLGRRGESDPRLGLHTDHLAAAERVAEIVRRYRDEGFAGSVGVLFMTDGEYDPYPLLDRAIESAERAENRRRFWERLHEHARRRGVATKADSLESDFRTWEATWAEPVDLNAHDLRGALFPVGVLRDRVGEISGSRGVYNALLRDATTSKPKEGTWFASACALADGDHFRMVRLRSGTSGPLAADARVLEVSEPSRLGPAFADVLAQWLELERSQRVEDREFLVPPGARALAVVTRARSQREDVMVRCGQRDYPLVDGLALIPNPPAGLCVLAGAGASDSFEAYSESRYRWALGVPEGFSILDREPELTLGLYRIDDVGAPAPAPLEDLYADPPATQRGEVRYPSGETASLRFTRGVDDLYRAAMPHPLNPIPGVVEARVWIEAMRFADGSPLAPVEVTAQSHLQEAVDVRLVYRGRDGVPVAVRGIEGTDLLRGAVLE